MSARRCWPPLPYPEWRETCTALHLYSQIVGKYRLARTPWLNHSWHATFYLNARGLTTSRIPDGARAIEVCFDLIDHAVIAAADDGREAHFDLGPMSVADFCLRFLDLIRAVGGRRSCTDAPTKFPTRFRSPRIASRGRTMPRPQRVSFTRCNPSAPCSSVFARLLSARPVPCIFFGGASTWP